MKKRFLLVSLLVLILFNAVAQTRKISGYVSSADDGLAVPGVTVGVKGTTIGTITDLNGNYTITVPESAKIISFSFVGMITQEFAITSANKIDVVMKSNVIGVNEVVVTAFGMKKERKALGYAVQDVKSEELTRTGSTSFASALQGKLSGVTITPSSGAPGASTQITIRGARSFAGNNTPLYIIDGMPVASQADYQSGSNGNSQVRGDGVSGTDISNRAVDIDPNDIESINILKGQAAAALYGIRATNGVIVITTKSGSAAKGGKPVITFSSYTSADVMSRKPEYQTTWAQGTPLNNGTGYTFNPNASACWGPKIVDLPNDPAYGGNVPNPRNGNNTTTYAGKYYVPQRFEGGLDPWVAPLVYDNVSSFFQTGVTLNNSVGINQSTDKTSYSFGLSSTNQTGIIASTSQNRHSARINVETKLSNFWVTGASMNYSSNYIKKAPTANDGLVATVFAAPVNYDLKGIPYQSPTNPYSQILYRATNFNNPYWNMEHNLFAEKTNRFFGNSYVVFTPTISSDTDKKLNFRYQFGADSYTTHYQDINEMGSKNSQGSIANYGITNTTYNSLLTANYDMDITPEVHLNVMLGNEINHQSEKSYREVGNDFNFGGWAHIDNTITRSAVSERKAESRSVGFFGNLSLSYKNMLYLNATGRQDVVSTMPRDNRTFFYPSLSMGFILTELDMFKGNKTLSFAKLRASYAEVGQAGSYLENYYTSPNYSGGFWVGTPVSYPLGGINSYIPNNIQCDPNLKPQNTVSFEIGTDLKFFNNRLGLEYTYSHQDINDQIFNVPLAGSTGVNSLTMNGGSIYTNTHEAVVSVVPVRKKDIDWNINLNFTKMDNYVSELAPGVQNITLGGFTTPQVRAGIGYKFPVIYGSAFAKDAQGRILVVEDPSSIYRGMPMAGAPGVIGNAAPDFILGGSTTFRWKHASISATFDWKSGGQMYHGTNALLEYTYGLAKSTEDRTTPFIYPGFKANGQPNDIQRGGQSDLKAYYDLYSNTLGNINEAYIYDNSFIKMRELTLSYLFPKYKSLQIRATAFARNILLWTELPNFDPEATQGNNNMSGAFERFTVPATSNFGLGLNLEF
jgi:TonB-linked SusC/RagA family outer membrane protein